jgi:glycerol-3-phosphate dehydrogenase
MLSVAGGKLTTYRRIALDALDQVGVRNLDRRPRPLPGATGRVEWPDTVGSTLRNHLLHLYGTLAAEVLAPAREDPALLEPMVDGRPDIRAQEVYARAREWARTDDDVRRRRTTVWLHSETEPGSRVKPHAPARQNP